MKKSYKIITTQEGVVELANYIKGSNILALDTETTSVNPRQGQIIGFSVSANIGEGYYFPTRIWNSEKQKLEQLVIDGISCDNIAKKLIELTKGKKLVGHNMSFDIRYVKNFYGIDLREDLYCDTMLLTHIIREDGPFGLKPLAIELQHELGIDAEKEANEEQILMKENIKKNGGQTTKENFEIYKADMELLGNYAAADTDLTLRLMTYFLPILKEQELWDFFFIDEVMPLYKTVTIQMEEVGTELDMDLIHKTKKDITVDLAKLEREIISDLMTIPQAKQWVMVKATKAFPPKKRGRFAEKLREITPFSIQGVNDFFATGDPSSLDPKDAMKVSLDLWKEKEGNYLNISSKQQLGEIVFKYMKIKPISQTRKGTDQFNDDMIEELSKKYTWAAKLRDYNKLTKINSAYVDRFLDGNENGRYYWYFKQHGTTSGRFSSDCQQMPRVLESGEVSDLVLKYNNVLRSFLQAEKGRKFIICDQSSLEPRVFASVSNDPNLINVFLENEDLYSRVAIQAFKLKGMSAKKSDPNYVKTVKPELRQRAKGIALAIPYGAGAWQIGQSLNININEAQRLIDGYLEGFPELAKWMSDTHLKVQTFGYIKNKTGRIRHLDRVKAIYEKFEDNLIDPKAFGMMKRMCKTPEQTQQIMRLRMEYKNGLNNAKNFQIQSLSASIMNRSAIAIHKEFKEKGLDAYIMLQIHDEFVINCAESIAEEVAKIVKYHMENTIKIPTGLVAEPNIASNFSEGHQ
jgi:DNA polymerase I-like protein with 3'-5' exonuclease and polymerase domains